MRIIVIRRRTPPRATRKGRERAQQDAIWKEILDALLEIFMAFFFPSYHERIDWSQGYQSLDKEMVEVTQEGGLNRHSGDKLFKVQLLNGQEEYLLLHIEVQGYPDKNFAKRVQLYNYLIRRKYNQTVRSFAILTDRNRKYRPTGIEIRDAGYIEIFQFPTVKLLDYWSSWEALEESNNPFALVVMAHLKTQRLKNRPTKLKEAKVQLFKLLAERGYERDYMLKLYQFLEWIVQLPPKEEEEFRDEVEKTGREKKMTFNSTYDRVLRREGRREGRIEGTLEIIDSLLKAKFGEASSILIERLQVLKIDELKEFATALLSFNSVEDANNWLSNRNL